MTRTVDRVLACVVLVIFGWVLGIAQASMWVPR